MKTNRLTSAIILMCIICVMLLSSCNKAVTTEPTSGGDNDAISDPPPSSTETTEPADTTEPAVITADTTVPVSPATPSPSAEIFLAGGTIPASAKIYPIVDETFPMSILNNTDSVISDENIWTLTHYADVYASFDDMAGQGVQTEEVSEFLTSFTVEQAISLQKDNGRENLKIDGVQLAQIIVEGTNEVEIIIWQRYSSGPNFSTNTTKDDIYAVLFKRSADGKWLENGIGLVKEGKTGSYWLEKDQITGKLSIGYPDK